MTDTAPADYLHHESIYRERRTASGWNVAAVDLEVLSYMRELLTAAAVISPARILELGCGMGNLSIPLSASGYRVVGIDVAPTAISVARERAAAAGSRAEFHVADLTKCNPFIETADFDCVVDGLCLHCIIGADRGALLRLVRAALKPTGWFLVITMCGDPRSRALRSRFDPASRCVLTGRTPVRYMARPDEILLAMTMAGFDIRYSRIQRGDAENEDMLLAAARIGPPENFEFDRLES